MWLAAAIVLPLVVVAVLWLALPLYKEPGAALLANPFWFPVVVMVVMLGLILSATAVCILAERKLAGFTVNRYRPFSTS